MGLSTESSTGSQTTKTLEDPVTEVQHIADAARAVREDIIILCHVGPIAMPADAQFVLSNTKYVHGFYGASSIERLPVETALREQVEKFKTIRFS